MKNENMPTFFGILHGPFDPIYSKAPRNVINKLETVWEQILPNLNQKSRCFIEMDNKYLQEILNGPKSIDAKKWITYARLIIELNMKGMQIIPLDKRAINEIICIPFMLSSIISLAYGIH